MGLVNKIVMLLTRSVSWLAPLLAANVAVMWGGQWMSLGQLAVVDLSTLVLAFLGLVKNLYDFMVSIPMEEGTGAGMTMASYLKTW